MLFQFINVKRNFPRYDTDFKMLPTNYNIQVKHDSETDLKCSHA